MEPVASKNQPMQSDRRPKAERLVIRPTDHSDTFSVATYNTLADCYSQGQWYCSPQLLSLDYRLPILAAEISSFNTDFICLQEVDTYDSFFKDLFESIGYGSHHSKKASSRRSDGLVIAWKRDRWRVVEIIEFDYNDKEKCRTDIGYRKYNIGMLVVFQDIASQELIIIGTSHYWWDPALDYVKFFQAKVYTERAYEAKEKYQCEVVLTGDFNSMPSSHTINFMLNKPLQFREYSVPIEEKIKEMYQPSRLRLKACYEEYCEKGFPDFTNYTADFKENIDYIMNSEGIVTVALGKLPSAEDLHGIIGIPNEVYPSDHLPLIAEFAKYKSL